jgi:hypothetical protein
MPRESFLPAPLSESDVKRHLENLKRDGYSVMEDAIPAALGDDIRAEIDRLERVRPGGDIPPQPFTGHVTRRWLDLLNDGPVWQHVAVHPWLLQILPGAIGEGFLLSSMATAVVGHGEPAQPIHDDDSVYAFPRPHPTLVCNSMWALTDFTEETGATRIIPGSHLWAADPDAQGEYETVPMLMAKGSICAFVGGLYHGAGANRSGRDRFALTINYCSGSMRQQENLMLGVSPQRMLSFDPQLQDILGFKMCKGAGHIFGQDPRREMQRHFAMVDPTDPYLALRDSIHPERFAKPRTRPAFDRDPFRFGSNAADPG